MAIEQLNPVLICLILCLTSIVLTYLLLSFINARSCKHTWNTVEKFEEQYNNGRTKRVVYRSVCSHCGKDKFTERHFN